MPTVRPISDLQRNMSDIASECEKTRRPIYLTRNGKTSLVVMDAAAFDEEMELHRAVLDREERVCQAILRGYEDYRAGRTVPLDKALDEADRFWGVQ